ncbi:MAG TPA: hypothetical protein PKV20_02565 [Anaerolineae bacterium]|nr:hypothetical protein [Anaerolineae bacterium]
MSDTQAQPDIEKLQANFAMEMHLLKNELLSSQMRIATSVRARHRTEAILQRYLSMLCPEVITQALGAQMSITEAAEYIYTHRLYGSDPKNLFRSQKAQPEEEAASTSPAPAVVVEPGVELSGDAVKFLYVLGMTVVANEARELWAQHTGKASGSAKHTALSELLDKGLLRVEQIPVPRYLTGYVSDTCYVLTDTGLAEYRRRFNSEPTNYEAIYAPYKSPEAWWMIRATKALIQAGNAHPANTRFTYTVYDPQGDAEAMRAAGFSSRYGSSEPDLIVVVKARSAGQPLWLAVECERGKYNSTRLKQKLAKNLEDYATAGFGGCYYIANNRDTARVLGGTLTRLRDDLTARPDAVSTAGFLALFTLEALRDTWLPTPRFILTEFFDRKLRQPNPNWPVDAARPERYFKYTPADREKDAGGKGQDTGGTTQDATNEEQDMGGALQEAEDEWPDEESAE